jgi:hypothetical protein
MLALQYADGKTETIFTVYVQFVYIVQRTHTL